MTEIGVEPSTGTIGGSYNNALAKTIIGLYKIEVIDHRGPWRNLQAVLEATLGREDGFNKRWRLETIGDMPPAEIEMPYLQQQTDSAIPV